MNKKIKYGIIGAGHLGGFHVQQLLNIKHVEVVGVYDLIYSKSKTISKKFNINCFKKLSSLLDVCDAISICTPASHHYIVADLALKNNCHLFIEKPITNNYKDACKIISLNKQYNKKIQIGHIERFNSAFINFLKFKPVPVFIESHRLSLFGKRGLDVDVVLDLMIHDLDLILSFVDSPVVNIYSSGTSVVSDFIDLANVRLEFKNNCVANITASRISNKQMRKMRVFEKNTYNVLDFQEQSLSRWTMKNKKNIQRAGKNIKPVNALYEELKSFILCIKNNSSVLVSPKQATRALKIAIEIQKSIEKKI